MKVQHMMYPDFTESQLDEVMERSLRAFDIYGKTPLSVRANFMRNIATALEEIKDMLIETAQRETNLPTSRLTNELTRTRFQLTSYAAFCEQGQWLDARIDTGNPDRNPPKPDLRKMLVPLGPVVVFGASNFPFAYSTAGGDTACALAAGCTVIVKAHPAHAATSELVADAIKKAIEQCNLPAGVFEHVHGANTLVGEMLVKHPFTKAVGFTGSYRGGKQLFDWGNQRKNPIPVFAEMGSVNPVFILPVKIKDQSEGLAKMLAASITLNAGQFCTNPGVIVVIDHEGLDTFIQQLSTEIIQTPVTAMLNRGIYNNYLTRKTESLAHPAVQLLAETKNTSSNSTDTILAASCIASTTAKEFMQQHSLQEEVFGPYSILVRCRDMEEMKQVAASFEGQLTATVIGTDNELTTQPDLLDILRERCGRLIFNGVPTGVEVCLSMQHGGPFPATTDSRFTSVGADGIRRFARPVSFQNCPSHLLPPELQNENPLHIVRTVNNELTNASINR